MNTRKHLARLVVVSSFFVLLLAALIWRMHDLTVLNRKFLQHQGDARSLRVLNIPAYRGMITDRQGEPLAVSTPVQAVWVNPKVFAPNEKQLVELAKLLGLSIKQLTKSTAAKNKEFVYLQRQLPPMIAKKIANLKIPGINFQQEFKRYYPEADSVAQLIGFTNVDDNGIEGLELAYQNWLMGVSGKKRVVKDRTGNIIEELGILQEPRPGHELRLSIDKRIQYFAYHELQDTVNKFGAKSGSVVVIDTQSGEVLAVANFPSFNPNARSRYSLSSYRNKAITDTFEPGSVIKPFSIASAFESGLFNPKSIIDTQPSWMIVHGHTIRDIHNYGVLDVSGVLEHSSNVGVTKMTLASPPDQLIGLLTRCGIGQRTESSYPGESDGFLVKPADANPFVLATLSFGYGMSVTALQLAKIYTIFSNQGRLMPINLLHYDKPVVGKQVISAKTSNQILAMLEAVVDVGTGQSAKVPGYRIAGKTGTSRIAGKQGYESNRHIASFVGIAPVSKPRLIVAVVVHEPSRLGYYGAAVAAPLFSKVMSVALRILDIQPDEATKSL
ncbi:MAG: peptidoglycan D,D-transpeptidase FtsI family protein [Legionella sp.]